MTQSIVQISHPQTHKHKCMLNTNICRISKRCKLEVKGRKSRSRSPERALLPVRVHIAPNWTLERLRELVRVTKLAQHPEVKKLTIQNECIDTVEATVAVPSEEATAVTTTKKHLIR